MKKYLYIACATIGLQSVSFGQIMWSGVQDIPIPFNPVGIFLNIDDITGAPDTSTLSFGTVVDPYDINFVAGGTAILTSTSFQAVTVGTEFGDPIVNLSYGTTISGTSVFSLVATASESHVGEEAGQFSLIEPIDPGYIGFKFTSNNTKDLRYGWMKVSLDNDASGGFIHEWAWNESGGSIDAGVIPEPSTYALIIGSLCLAIFVVKRKLQGSEPQKES